MSVFEAAVNLLRPHVIGTQIERLNFLSARQERLFRDPDFELGEDYDRIYTYGDYQVGMPADITRVFDHFAERSVYLVLGAQLGDEGKVRIVDNILEYLGTKICLKKVYVT